MPTAKGSVPWNAGTGQGWTDKRGYRWLYVKENGRRVARREHRVIMERALGRKLDPWELVHHKDGNTANNMLTNLEVTEWGAHTAEHHTGSRRDGDARRSFEAFALMREQLKRERESRADLLAALRGLLDCVYVSRLENNQGSALAASVEQARLAIEKAGGRA